MSYFSSQNRLFKTSFLISPLLIFFVFLFACSNSSLQTTNEISKNNEKNRRINKKNKKPLQLKLEVIKRLPHHTKSFTQGLLIHRGVLFESVGLYGKSAIQKIDKDNGQILQSQKIDKQYFAEGLDFFAPYFYQLTWQKGKVLLWDEDLNFIKTMDYQGEGWGLCATKTQIITSNGTAFLSFRNPKTFKVEKKIEVKIISRSIPYINELECVEDFIYANVWQRNEILKINQRTGQVEAIIDASGLLSKEEENEVDVLNGIAHIPRSDHFLITGKLWPYMFEVKFK